ncbi:PREDICTED: J protein JJJ2 isoform X1 [Brassica oleracea var. oleracea]|uniref:J protein JJJ2 isoform X1 n=1 Tax=Brassica oleracea var. oleracea TaxID=109376 RepID=UPI0006A75073|nr:PREDICTED: J protein JJJ2 isoform X1 [Brassica oleracea var. oleracea]
MHLRIQAEVDIGQRAFYIHCLVVMNINRDEALRAQALAEALMQKSNFTAARKLAIKAHSMDSTLENISHMTMVCEVHCAATEKTFGNNEMDWYGILQVDVNADDAIIKKQYRKLALLLHPDKNKLPGAESAFKLIGEAQRMLLDKEKRMLHDVKRRTRPAAPVPPYRPQQASVNTRNVFNGVRPQGQPPHGFAPRPTFWTSCPFCGSRYEYGREHIKREVACLSCKKLFTAFEVSFPTQQNMFPGQKACPEPHKRPYDSKNVPSASTAENNNEKRKRKRKRKDMDEPSESSEIESSSDSDDDSNNVPPGKKATASTAENNNGKRKRKDIDEASESSDSESSSDSEDDDAMAAGDIGSNGGREPRRSVRSKRQVSYNESLSDDEDVDLVNDVGEGSGKNVDTEKEEEEKQTDEDHHHQSNEALNPKEKIQESLDDWEDEESSLGGEEANVINCEDPEFSDFDKLREKSCFEERQVWALYDEGEGMPRFYAVIRKVTKPRFSVKYVWLEPEETRDLPVSVGRYVLGDEGKTSSCDLFSHLVQSKTRSNAKNFTVFPGKGETWALFKNWDMEEEEDSDSPREYEFVEILSDHEEGGGTVSVGFLSKVEGFKYVYSPLPEEESDTFEIPPHELFRFSHRVPSFRLKGTEGRGVLEGWYELDPAALPVLGSQDQDHHQSPP